jgi:hypothetical protein
MRDRRAGVRSDKGVWNPCNATSAAGTIQSESLSRAKGSRLGYFRESKAEFADLGVTIRLSLEPDHKLGVMNTLISNGPRARADAIT